MDNVPYQFIQKRHPSFNVSKLKPLIINWYLNFTLTSQSNNLDKHGRIILLRTNFTVITSYFYWAMFVIS